MQQTTKQKNTIDMLKKITLIALLTIALSSCGSREDLVYFQDAQSGALESIYGQLNTIQPGDMLTVSVSSSNPALAVPYNLFSARSQISNATSLANSSSKVISNVNYEGYTVDSEGYINFAVLGKIEVAGLTREQVAAKIQALLVDKMPDPVVTVTIATVRITVAVLPAFVSSLRPVRKTFPTACCILMV